MIRVGLLDRILEAVFPRQFGEAAIVEPEEDKERIQEDEGETITDIFFRKIIKSTHYCFGKEKTFFGFTFEDNNTDRGDWLIRKIEDSPGASFCSESRKRFGYDDFSESTSDPPFTWPDFEVGEE